MNDSFSSVLDSSQVESQFRGMGVSQFRGLYDEQHVCDPRRYNPALILRSITNFGPDLYAQNKPDEMSRSNERLMELQRLYGLLSDSSLIAAVLAKIPVLYTLLKEAVEPLQEAFGEQKFLQLEALESDDDTVLRVIVKLPLDTSRPAELLQVFKRDWWLKNCFRSQASLVFDYETGHGF